MQWHGKISPVAGLLINEHNFDGCPKPACTLLGFVRIRLAKLHRQLTNEVSLVYENISGVA